MSYFCYSVLFGSIVRRYADVIGTQIVVFDRYFVLT